MIRIPKRMMDRSRVEEFIREVEEVELLESGENLIVDIQFYGEESGYDYLDESGDGRLDSLAPLRNDLLAGDLRLFYLLWLTAVERDILWDEAREPLPSVAPLHDPLEAFAEFFGLDPDLVQAAAESPGNADGEGSLDTVPRKVVESVPEDEKVALLLRLADGDPHVAAEVRNTIRVGRYKAQSHSGVKRRTVAEIRKRTLAVRQEREAAAARRREEERLRKAREAERLRRERLDFVRRRGAQVWDDVESDIERKNASSYDRAVSLLADLQALAEETGREAAFSRRVWSIRDRHRGKQAFLRRLRERRIGFNV